MNPVSAADVLSFGRSELATIADASVRDALLHLMIEPELHVRDWDYGAPGEQYPCWTVVKDTPSNFAIVYSAHGHGPGTPWGLVALSDRWFGMDCGWFLRLEDAFVNPHMASCLPIWDIVSSDRATVVFSSLSLDEAFARRDAMDAALEKPLHLVLYRSRLSSGTP
jgi:hypothetical protein